MTRFYGLILGLTLTIFADNAIAQDRFYHVYMDADNNNATGCDVDLPDFATAINGAEGRITITTDSNQPPNIISTDYHLCNGSAFDAGTTINPAALGLNTSINGNDVFEVKIPQSALRLSFSNSVIFYYVTQSDTASDIVLSNSNGVPISLEVTFAIPAIGLLSLSLILLGFLFLTHRSINKNLTVMLVFVSFSSLAWAMAIVIDGQTSDWNNINPENSDPVNDTSAPGSFADLTQVYLTHQGNHIYFRMDVVDVENKAPIANNTDDTTLEENTVTITVTGSDAENEPLTFTVNNAPINGTLSGFTVVNDITSTIDYAPNIDFNGNDTFTFVANDGQANSGTGIVEVSVTGINDEPSFTAGANVSANEDAGAQTIATWATDISAGPTNESGQNLTFNITVNDNPSLFTAGPSVDPITGDLTYTSASDANGISNISIELMDDGGTSDGGDDTSPSASFNIIVDEVNDAPSFTAGTDQSVLEGAGAQTVTGWASAISPGPTNEATQTVSFNVTNDNNALFDVQPVVDSTGNLNYTLGPASLGTATVNISISDNGGTTNGGVDTSAIQTFTISVIKVNDKPSFTIEAD